MCNDASDGRRDAVETVGDDPDQPPALAADVVVFDGRPATCTLFPVGATELERLTSWMTAEEGSFVSLESMR